MITIAGVECPCLDCSCRCTSSAQAEIYHAVFKAIGSREPVVCSNYCEPQFRGLEGVRP